MPDEEPAVPTPPRARKQDRHQYELDRRDAIKGMGFVAVLGLLTAASGGVLATLFSTPRARAAVGRYQLKYAPSVEGESWFDQLVGQDVIASDLSEADWALATAEGSTLARPVILIRLARPPHDPGGSGGFVDTLIAFYSGCVHACCGVSGPVSSDELLYCPCHFSRFDATQLVKGDHSGLSYVGAPAVSGPAKRPLPQAPIAIDAEGKVQLLVETRNREWYGYC